MSCTYFCIRLEAHNVELAHYWWCWDIWLRWYLLLLIIKTLRWRFHSNSIIPSVLISRHSSIGKESSDPFDILFFVIKKKRFCIWHIIIHCHRYSFWGAQIVFMLASMFCSHVFSDFSCLLAMSCFRRTSYFPGLDLLFAISPRSVGSFSRKWSLNMFKCAFTILTALHKKVWASKKHEQISSFFCSRHKFT